MAYRSYRAKRKRRSSVPWRMRRKRYRVDRRRRGRTVTRKTYGGTLTYRKLNLGAFPKTKTVYLRYVENFSLDPGAAPGSVAYVFRSNSLHDPNFTGAGHQPMFYDNYSALYGTYQVVKATIRFVVLDNHVVNAVLGQQTSGTTTGAVEYFANNERASRIFVINDLSSADYPTDINTLIEEGCPNMKWKYAPQNTSPYVQSITHSVWPHKLADLSFKDNTLKGIIGANAGVDTYFICGMDSYPSSNTGPLKCQAILTFKVRFTDLKVNQTQN